jgi:integrase
VLEHSELVSYHTLRSRIDAVKAVHLANAQSWFPDDPVKAALERAREAGGTRFTPPLLERDMLDLARSLTSSDDIGATHDWALIALGAAFGLDGRELCSLTRGDLVLDQNGLTLPRFTTLWLDAPSLSRNADRVRCPVAAIESWCALATTSSQTLFYDLRPDHEDAPLHALDITRIVRQRMRAIGRDPRYFGAASLKAHRFFASASSHRT